MDSLLEWGSVSQDISVRWPVPRLSLILLLRFQELYVAGGRAVLILQVGTPPVGTLEMVAFGGPTELVCASVIESYKLHQITSNICSIYCSFLLLVAN